MTHSDSIHYLEKAGFHFKPAESPDLWTHLESRFGNSGMIGPKFAPMPAQFVSELISRGEDALLEAMVELHRRSGALGRVAQVVELPYIVGAGAMIPLTKADSSRALQLIEYPGSAKERVINVLPAAADDIPCTNRMTVTGGLYPDGHTAGYFDLCAGEPVEAGGKASAVAYLATMDEIAGLAREMETKIEDIAAVTRRECEAMLAKVRKLLA